MALDRNSNWSNRVHVLGNLTCYPELQAKKNKQRTQDSKKGPLFRVFANFRRRGCNAIWLVGWCAMVGSPITTAVSNGHKTIFTNIKKGLWIATFWSRVLKMHGFEGEIHQKCYGKNEILHLGTHNLWYLQKNGLNSSTPGSTGGG